MVEVHLTTSASLQALQSNNQKEIIQIKDNMIQNPNWQEANQLAIYKHGRGVELRTTKKQIQQVIRAGLKLGASMLRFQHADHFASHCLPTNNADWIIVKQYYFN